MTKVYDTATDLITFARSSSGTALRRVGYGENLVDNGDFTSGLTSWEQNETAFSVVGDELVYDASGSGSRFGQVVNFTAGKVYQLTFDATISSTFRVQLVDQISNDSGAQIILNPASTGANTVVFVPNSSFTYLVFRRMGINNNSTFDNVSVKEVIFDRATDPLVLFNHPDDIPRIEYGSDGSLKGLLIEEQRTNLLTNSADFSESAWSENFSGFTMNAVGPDGASNSAGTLTDDISGGAGSAYMQVPVTVSTETTYTFSIFAKADQLSDIQLRCVEFTTPGSVGVFFDLSAGEVGNTSGSGATGEIEDFGRGWYRCSITFTTDVTDIYGKIRVHLANGESLSVSRDGTSSVLFYGAQFEEGSFATSYIPTSGSQETRSADVASIPVSAFGYNQDAGTIVVEATPIVLNSGNLLNLNTSGSDATSIYANPNTSGHLVVRNTTTQVNLDAGSFASGQASKLGLAIKENDFAVCLDAGTVASDNSGTLPSPIATMAIGSTAPHNGFCNSHIKSLKYYPRRLTDAQLQELTA
jgi:hypothetical protein